MMARMLLQIAPDQSRHDVLADRQRRPEDSVGASSCCSRRAADPRHIAVQQRELFLQIAPLFGDQQLLAFIAEQLDAQFLLQMLGQVWLQPVGVRSISWRLSCSCPPRSA